MDDKRPASPPSRVGRLTRRQLAIQEEQLKHAQNASSLPPQPESTKEEATEAATIPEAVAVTPEDTTQEKYVEETTSKAQSDVAAELTEKPLSKSQVQQVQDSTGENETIAISEPEAMIAEAEQVETHESEVHVTDTKPAERHETELATSEAEPPNKTHEMESVISESESKAADDQIPQVITPSVEITSESEPMILPVDEPSQDTVTPAKNRTSSHTSRSSSKSPMRLEESFEAIDALEEALENVGKEFRKFDELADEISPEKPHFPKNTNAASSVHAKTSGKACLPARVSRNPSIAPQSMKPVKPSIARASSVRTAPTKDVRKGSGEVTDYLASKRRPISMSFPTPPPPPKSTRPPTKPTFQLSSDAVAAKLKAQKEERAKREAEGVSLKQRPISMPPPPRSTKPPTKSNFQLPGEATAAKLKAQKEERLKRAAEGTTQPRSRPISMPPPPKSTKPLTKSNFQLPGETIAAKLKAQKEERQKREEEAEAARKAALKTVPFRKPATVPIHQPPAVRPQMSLPSRTQKGVTIPPPPPPPTQPSIVVSQRSSSLTSKRSSFMLSESRSTSTSSMTRVSIVTPSDIMAQKVKGKEIFNKDKVEQEARERERREKEEAAKKARAEAAERGRVASREWAERQRKKMVEAVRGIKEGKA